MVTDVKPQTVVGLVQINNSFSGQSYLPYSAGILQAFVQRNAADPGRFRFLLPVYKRIRVDEAVERMAGADVVGFSTYVWNGRISLEIARRLKQQRKDVLIVFGGPHVPDHSEQFLRDHPFIDIAVHNEGEQVFLDMLEQFPDRDWQRLHGVSYIDADGTFRRTAPGPRIRELSLVPSPFLDGIFTPLMEANPQETWIGLWETNRGCPFQCTFCDWGSATAAKVNQFEMERLKREVDWFATNRMEFIFCCDANFGILKRDVELAQYVAEVKKRTGYPKALSVQNTKNATERAYETQKILSDAKLNKGVALSMQSIDPVTLKNIKRENISLDTYLELQRRFTKDGVETYSDLILGLPGETYDSFVDGLDTLIESGQHNRIQFNNLSILPNAEMGAPDYQARFGMVTVESEIINIHGQRNEDPDDVPEVQQLVVATASMPHDAWRRTRALSWMAAFLHFDKLFQIPFVVAHTLTGIRYRHLIESFMEAGAADFPLIASIRDKFLAEAKSIQEGGPEYVYSAEWLGIYWPADEYMFIKLTADGQLDQFYEEAGRLLNAQLAAHAPSFPREPVRDAILLNRALIKQPFVTGDVAVRTDYDILALHKAILRGQPAVLRQTAVETVIDRSSQSYDDFGAWCREVVWYGNKKGAYLYGERTADRQLSGHY
ncbi:MAG TPA: radical SAM protein [Azospirillaceae bacterium]|nr:radical SAM protein [Azospirillaceae bacterium]